MLRAQYKCKELADLIEVTLALALFNAASNSVTHCHNCINVFFI
jgi:hypothetical protein